MIRMIIVTCHQHALALAFPPVFACGVHESASSPLFVLCRLLTFYELQYAGMKFRTERRSIQGHQVFAVQKLHYEQWVDWVYISQSTIPGAGRGVFAACDFEDGEFIGRYLGRVLGFKVDFIDAVLKVHARLHNGLKSQIPNLYNGWCSHSWKSSAILNRCE